MFAVHYYASWLGGLIPQRDRLGKLEVRYDPRDISHIYVRDPESRHFRPVERRDGRLASLTLWEHEAERARRRDANHRSSVAKVEFRREIAAIVETAKPPRSQLRNAVRGLHAGASQKPFAAMQAKAPVISPHPSRQKSRLPVEDW